MAKQSAGILLYRERNGAIEVLLVHPGGPVWARKDDGAWSIPKGEFADGEEPEAAARRELKEETGWTIEGALSPLTPVRQAGGKTVYAWSLRGDVDPQTLVSNRFSMEWPPRSGRRQEFPEVDRAGWFGLAEAAVKINQAQAGLLRELERLVGGAPPRSG
jgi:predicted NUDIX family NTP pyrophosphohydrolase